MTALWHFLVDPFIDACRFLTVAIPALGPVWGTVTVVLGVGFAYLELRLHWWVKRVTDKWLDKWWEKWVGAR